MELSKFDKTKFNSGKRENFMLRIFNKGWFQSILTILVILLMVILWLEDKEMFFYIKIIVTAISWIIIFLVYHSLRSKSLRKQIEKEFYDKNTEIVEKRVNEILEERKLNEFRKIMKNFEYLITSSEGGSFIYVFNNIGEHLPKLVLRIEKIKMEFLTFQEKTKDSTDLQLLNEQLLQFIKSVEVLSSEFGDKRKDWYDNYNWENLDNLIINYEGFISQLNSFSVKELESKYEFKSLKWLLLRRKREKNES